jgi:type I restriction enzyme S subunit
MLVKTDILKNLSLDMHQGINTVTENVEYLANGIPILQSKNITQGYLNLEDVKYLSKISYEKYQDKYQPKINDVLVCNIGTIGSSLRISKEENFLIAWNLFLIKLDENKLYSQYFAHYLNYLKDKKYFDKFLTGGTVKFINKKTMEKIPVPLPPLPIQKRIAEILDTADALRRKDEALLKKYDELAQAIFIDMFGDPVKNEKGWEVMKLGDIVESFKYGTNLKSNDDITGTPVLRIPNIIGNTINLKDLKYSQFSSQELKTTQLQIGDLLFVRSNGNPNYIGRSALFLNQGAFSYASYLIRARLKSQSVYLANYIQFALSYKTYRPIILKKATTTAGNYNINTESLKSLLLPIPEEHLLKSFFTKLEICIALKEKKNSSDKSENLFNSLLQKAFNGELIV